MIADKQAKASRYTRRVAGQNNTRQRTITQCTTTQTAPAHTFKAENEALARVQRVDERRGWQADTQHIAVGSAARRQTAVLVDALHRRH